MGNTRSDDTVPIDPTGESDLRGSKLGGSDSKAAVNHTKQQKGRDPDAMLHLDNEEEDTLYDDGLELEDDSDTLADTRKNDE